MLVHRVGFLVECYEKVQVEKQQKLRMIGSNCYVWWNANQLAGQAWFFSFLLEKSTECIIVKKDSFTHFCHDCKWRWVFLVTDVKWQFDWGEWILTLKNWVLRIHAMKSLKKEDQYKVTVLLHRQNEFLNL